MWKIFQQTDAFLGKRNLDSKHPDSRSETKTNLKKTFIYLSVLNVLLLQIHAHYELKKSSRHRKNLAITGGVALSIITAPVIAAVSVGKKVYVCRHRQRKSFCTG